MAARLRKGDSVEVIAGSAKGERGVIKSVNPKAYTAIVEGVNLCVRHEKKSANSEGGKKRKELPLNMCKLAFVDTKTNSTTKVGFRFENGNKVRFSRKTGITIDG
jgi:large subunit ribosomal protein L24